MEHVQIDLDFGDVVPALGELHLGAANVVELDRYRVARNVKLKDGETSKLVASIVESVDAVWDDLEAM